MDAIAERLPGVRVQGMGGAGVPADAAEAMALLVDGAQHAAGDPESDPPVHGGPTRQRPRRDPSCALSRRVPRSEFQRESVVGRLDLDLTAAIRHVRAQMRQHEPTAVEIVAMLAQLFEAQMEIEGGRRAACTRR